MRKRNAPVSLTAMVAVACLCGTAMATCWDIWISNEYTQDPIQLGAPCIHCETTAFTGIEPGDSCEAPVSLTECAQFVCYKGTISQDQNGYFCDWEIDSLTIVDYCPIVCQSPCQQPWPGH